MTERETLLLREFKERLDKLIGLHQKMKVERQLFFEEKTRLNEQINLLTISNQDLTKKMEDLKFATLATLITIYHVHQNNYAIATFFPYKSPFGTIRK